jgi:hypothetical protein
MNNYLATGIEINQLETNPRLFFVNKHKQNDLLSDMQIGPIVTVIVFFTPTVNLFLFKIDRFFVAENFVCFSPSYSSNISKGYRNNLICAR